MQKPGVMVYFGDARVVEKLSDTEAGRLFRAILAYAEHGKLPPFAENNGRLSLIWVHFQQSVDNDSKRYEQIKSQKKYARYCGVQRANGLEPLPFDEWSGLTESNGCRQPSTDVTNTNTNSITNTNPIANTGTNPIGGRNDTAEILKAEYEAAFGGGPSDLSEWKYLCTTYHADTIRAVIRDARQRGLRHEAAWAYVSTKIVFQDD